MNMAAEDVLLLIKHGHTSAKSISDNIYFSRRTVFRHLKSLLDNGIVCRDEEGRYQLTQKGMNIAEQVESSFRWNIWINRIKAA